MPDKFFLDTNILVYSFDESEPRKSAVASGLIKDALRSQQGIISYQVIQEFINVALQKFKVPMKTDDCKSYIKHFLTPLCLVFPSIELFHAALDIKAETSIGFYDALIVAAALEANAKTLYTEDLNNGQKIRTVRIVNPFV